MAVLKGWSRVKLLKRNKNKSSSILKKRPLPPWLGGACACQPAQLWEYNVRTSACLNPLGRDGSGSWWESEENGKCCVLSRLIRVSRPIRARPGPAGSKRVINTTWRRRCWCVQRGRTDGSPGGDRRREGELKGQETLNMRDRGGKPWRSGLLWESVSHQSILKPLREGNLQPKILLASTDCQSAPASANHTRDKLSATDETPH